MDLQPLYDALNRLLASLPEEAAGPRLALTVVLLVLEAVIVFRPLPIGDSGIKASLVQQTIRPYVPGVGLGKVSTSKAITSLAGIVMLPIATLMALLAGDMTPLYALAGLGSVVAGAKAIEDTAAKRAPTVPEPEWTGPSWTEDDAHVPAT